MDHLEPYIWAHTPKYAFFIEQRSVISYGIYGVSNTDLKAYGPDAGKLLKTVSSLYEALQRLSFIAYREEKLYALAIEKQAKDKEEV